MHRKKLHFQHIDKFKFTFKCLFSSDSLNGENKLSNFIEPQNPPSGNN